MTSMRRRLLVSLICGFAAVSASAAYLIFRTARIEAAELFDYELHAVAKSLPRGAAAAELTTGHAPDFEGIANDGIAIQVWDTEGRTIYQSLPDVTLPQLGDGFHSADVAGTRWYAYGLVDGDRVVQVAQPAAIREELALKLAARVLWPLALLFPCAILLVWFVVTRGLRPLTTLSELIGTRSPDLLDPLRLDRVDSEFMPLVTRMNDLLQRLDAALRSQRLFVADAAHELRSPLTALKLQFELACRDGMLQGNPELLSRIDGRLNRTIHLVRQLLALAHEDTRVTAGAGAFDLVEVARQVVGDASILAEQKGIDLGLLSSGGGQVPAVGDPAAITVLLANLVDNAIRYTPEGGRVDVSVGWQDDYAWADVSDDGPGIPSQELTRVFDRFYRPAGSPGHGSGLGLAIARRVAERHHAELRLANRVPGPGLSARLLLFYYQEGARTALGMGAPPA